MPTCCGMASRYMTPFSTATLHKSAAAASVSAAARLVKKLHSTSAIWGVDSETGVCEPPPDARDGVSEAVVELD